MSDAELLEAERVTLNNPLGWRAPRALRLRARAGSPRACVFCGHALDGSESCAFRRLYQVGEPVRAKADGSERTFPMGRFMGDNKVALTKLEVIDGTLDHAIPRVVGIVELPDAWLPAPCGCDHRDVPVEETRRAYEEAHGVDVRVTRTLDGGDIIYDVTVRNADGTPWRWSVNGQIKLWKRDPFRFRLPLKRGMYNFDALDASNAQGFRTREEWAYSYAERKERGIDVG